jgi:hypothetical protein
MPHVVKPELSKGASARGERPWQAWPFLIVCLHLDKSRDMARLSQENLNLELTDV